VTPDPSPTDDDPEIPDRFLADALDLVVAIAAAGSKQRPPLAFPGELRSLFRLQRLSGAALRTARRAIVADDVFRRRIGAVVGPELLDEPGLLWLQRPEGWRERLRVLADEAAADASAADLAAQLRGAERRRLAAQQAAGRAVAELAAARAVGERLGADLEATTAELVSLRGALAEAQAQVQQLRLDVRRAADRQRTLEERDERTARELAATRDALAEAERVRDDAVAARAAVVEQMMATQATASTPPPTPRRSERAAPGRRPIALPGGLVGSSRAAAEFLVRVPGVVVLVDGYNVAKLGWPGVSLEAQRDRCVAAAEDVVLRFGGVDVRIVFDGADVPGIPAGLRRLVPVHFSPEGVTADAVLCAEVARLPGATPVVVVTDDREILDDVRGRGANGLPSATWLDLAGHRSTSR
jgi:hypothetical protein